MVTRTLALLLAATSLAGCTVGPDFEHPSAFSPLSWFSGRQASPAVESLPVQDPVDPAWWDSFRDPELSALVKRAATDNLNVRAAAARLAQSRAQRGISAADAYPQFNGNASYTREKPSDKGATSLFTSGAGGGSPATQSNGLGSTRGAVQTPKIPAFDLFQSGFDASWELDLWGRVRRQVESADAAVEASEEARHGMVLSTVAEVARDYLQLRGIQANLRITRRNLATARETVDLTRSRAASGLGTDLDISQAVAQAELTESQIPQLEQQEAQTINAIGLLLALPPRSLSEELVTEKPIPAVPPTVPVGLPSELARRRPDIRQAEAALHSAVADIGVAQAAFYPTVTLSGSAALQATQFHNLGSWSALTYGFGPSLTLPIFEGGRIRRTVELRQGQQQEAGISYQKTVLQALGEVDDSLTAYDREQVRHRHLAIQVRESDQALALSRSMYRQGLADFLTVLTAERTALQAEQQLSDSTTTIATNLVALYKALGGGWETITPSK